jgi:hypothetical protein
VLLQCMYGVGKKLRSVFEKMLREGLDLAIHILLVGSSGARIAVVGFSEPSAGAEAASHLMHEASQGANYFPPSRLR